MGRPPIKETGPMTGAEREARRRAKRGKSINRHRRRLYKDKKLNAAAAARLEASLNAPPLPDGAELRIGDCKEKLVDIPDNSVALILTDPPYGRNAEPLYKWLAKFAERVLVPGGSLICYTGTALARRDGNILAERLTEWWTAILLHHAAQKMFRAGVRANHKPILWFVKGNNRRIVHERGTIIPDVLNDPADNDEGRSLSLKDKSAHAWAQGDAGVRVWIHHLTRPEMRDENGEIIQNADLILDPFAGPGTWGRIAANMGRRWIGCDIKQGGSETIAA